MKDKMNGMQRPTGETGGGDMPNKGAMTNVGMNYGADLNKGNSGAMGIKGDTKSDSWDRNLPMPAEKGKA